MAQLKSLEQELQKKTLSVAEQIKQSEANLQAHEKAIAQQQQVRQQSIHFAHWIEITTALPSYFLCL